MIDGIHYLNSGDWVETLSALTEDNEGNWQVMYYSDFALRESGSNVLALNIAS